MGLRSFHSKLIFERKKEQHEEALAEQQALQEEEGQLLQSIENYQDDEFIKEIARRDYYLTLPGETRINVSKQASD